MRQVQRNTFSDFGEPACVLHGKFETRRIRGDFVVGEKCKMTMDIAQQDREAHKMPSPRIACDNLATQSKPSVKRPFDVAFLMLPDEKLKNRRQQAEKQLRLNSGDAIVTYPTQISVKSDESLRGELSEKRLEHFIGGGSGAVPPRHFAISPNFIHATNHNNNDIMKNGGGRFSIQNGTPSPRMYDDPTIVPHDLIQRVHEMPKSAFTKVPHNNRQESPLPPPQSLSPGQLSCPSNSPPVSTSPPRNIIYHNFRPEYQFMNASPFHTISQMQQIAQNQQKFKQQFAYRPQPTTTTASQNPMNGGNDMPVPSAYLPTAGFPFAAGNAHPFVAQPDLTGIVRNPAAAALLTTLIPPTIATSFTLTAQNVCAKCNISFRKFLFTIYLIRQFSILLRVTYRAHFIFSEQE